jgi:VWFA-related protein
MRARSVLLYSLFFSILLSASVAARQAPQSPDVTSPPQESPVIRSTTHLVQVSVVVTGKKGEPITGLKKEDFTILDESSPQQIAFFSAESPAPAVPKQLLPKNVYTNRYDLKGQDPGAVTVVLFDALNTSSHDQEYVRQQVIKFLKALKPQDHVAIYALTTQLLLLHEFTQDSAALVNAANQFKPKDLAAYDASHPMSYDVPALASDPSWQKFQAAVNQTDARIADQNKANRAQTTAEAFTAIANHVATIPGRKSLIWVSGSFPLQIVVDSFTPDRESQLLGGIAAQTARSLNRADMVLYPVDASGVMPNAMMDPQNPYSGAAISCLDCINEAPGPSSGMNARQELRDSERIMADATGGQAFYGNNDIRAAMTRVFDDGRYAYTIGFYPNHGEWNGKYRKIKIRTNAEGAKLRYRAGYYAEAEKQDSDESKAKEAMRTAAMSPLDATGLGMIVTGRLTGKLDERKVELHVGLDPKQLLLQDTGDHRKGAVDLYFVQRDDAGETIAAENQRIAFNFEEKQYEYLGKNGLVLARHLKIAPQTTNVRVFARDTSSDTLGSVTIPVQAIFEGPQSVVTPAGMESPK